MSREGAREEGERLAPGALGGRRRRLGAGVNIVLFILTFFTTTLAGAYLAHFDYDLIRLWIELKYHPEWLLWWLVDGLMFAIPLMAILLAHELGHYLVSRHYEVSSSLPFFIPGPNLVGTFGAVIIMDGQIPHRKALFDIGAAGPLAGLVVTVFAMFAGLATAEIESFQLPRGGVLFGPNLLLYLVVGHWPGLGSSAEPQLIVSPLLDAACVGFLITAINLLPLGQLDGGHIAYAVLGPRAKWAGVVALAALAALSLFWPTWIFLGIIFLLLLGRRGLQHPPPAYPWFPVGRERKILALLILLLFVLILAPSPVVLISEPVFGL